MQKTAKYPRQLKYHVDRAVHGKNVMVRELKNCKQNCSYAQKDIFYPYLHISSWAVGLSWYGICSPSQKHQALLSWLKSLAKSLVSKHGRSLHQGKRTLQDIVKKLYYVQGKLIPSPC